MKNIKSFGPQKNSRFKNGIFDKYNPKKYIGERPIIYRSSWELKFMILCEFNPEVIEWSSENIQIPYVMKELKKGKFVQVRHNYYPDFFVKLKNGEKVLIEIKPENQSPKTDSDIQRDPVQYKNARKWKAALEWAKLNGHTFRVITETHLKTRIF